MGREVGGEGARRRGGDKEDSLSYLLRQPFRPLFRSVSVCLAMRWPTRRKVSLQRRLEEEKEEEEEEEVIRQKVKSSPSLPPSLPLYSVL